MRSIIFFGAHASIHVADPSTISITGDPELPTVTLLADTDLTDDLCCGVLDVGTHKLNCVYIIGNDNYNAAIDAQTVNVASGGHISWDGGGGFGGGSEYTGSVSGQDARLNDDPNAYSGRSGMAGAAGTGGRGLYGNGSGGVAGNGRRMLGLDLMLHGAGRGAGGGQGGDGSGGLGGNGGGRGVINCVALHNDGLISADAMPGGDGGGGVSGGGGGGSGGTLSINCLALTGSGEMRANGAAGGAPTAQNTTAAPTSVTDNGDGTITFVVNALTAPGGSPGITMKVYKTATPGVFENCTVTTVGQDQYLTLTETTVNVKTMDLTTLNGQQLNVNGAYATFTGLTNGPGQEQQIIDFLANTWTLVGTVDANGHLSIHAAEVGQGITLVPSFHGGAAALLGFTSGAGNLSVTVMNYITTATKLGQTVVDTNASHYTIANPSGTPGGTGADGKVIVNQSMSI